MGLEASESHRVKEFEDKIVYKIVLQTISKKIKLKSLLF
jgi:hypothetical protein